MAKAVSNDVLNGALNVVAQATQMVACSGQPLTYAAANTGKLAAATLAPADFVVSPGVVSGLQVTIAGKAGSSVIAAGTADHVALIDPGTSRLLYVTTCPAQALPLGGTVSFAAWSVEIDAPV